VNVEKYRAYANQLVRNPDDTEALVNQFAILSERREYGTFYLPIASGGRVRGGAAGLPALCEHRRRRLEGEVRTSRRYRLSGVGCQQARD
jgi:hypothetical protein